MKLTYIYHSCFAIEGSDFSIVIDYYKDSGQDGKTGFVHDVLLKQSKKLYVLSSHSHPDHFNPAILQWKQEKENIQYVFSSEIREAGKTTESDAFYLDKLGVYEDGNLRIKAFGSTDIGISFLIEAENKRIFHAGDLNNWHWNEESTEEEARQCEINYLNELEILAKEYDTIDVVMFPVDPRLGKDYMRGAEQFVKRIKTGIFIPMHFGVRYKEAAEFKAIAESNGCRFMEITSKDESIEF